MFKNKANIFLSFILVFVLATLGFFAYKLFINVDAIYVPDFSNKNINDVQTWCKSLADNPCTITYDYSESIEKDNVIYQSIEKNQKLVSNISFIISSGQKPSEIDVIEIDENSKKEDVEKWAIDNSITNINYIEETSETICIGYVIKIEPSDVCNVDETINVYISSGSVLIGKNNKEIESNIYNGLTQNQFEAKMKEIGLNPIYASKKDEYSSTISKGSIIWHGSGSYIDGEDIRYGLSKGESDLITVTAKTYVGLSLEEFKNKTKALGIVASHSENKDEYSSTIKEGYIVWHGSGTYEKNEEIHYGLSKGIGNEIIVKAETYKGYSLDQFKTKVEELGLVASHSENRDDYSSTIEEGKILWHGSGTYEKNEEIHYGLSKGKDPNNIVVNSSDYVGKTLEEFTSLVSKLGTTGIIPKHVESKDAYSDTIAKGSIVWHGSGKYKDNENISYGLSLGSKPKVTVTSYANKSESDFLSFLSNNNLKAGNKTSEYSSTVEKDKIISNDTGSFSIESYINYKVSLGKDNRVSVSSKANSTEEAFKSYLSELGLKAGTRTEQSSSSVSKGNIISNQTGTFNKGDSVNYVVSSGKTKLSLNSATVYNNLNSSINTYDDMKANMETRLKGFTNVSYNAVESMNLYAGKIESISVNGSTTYEPGEYDFDTKIVVNIVSKYKQQ